ncbi:ImmA/IrrE family metallo-endopeptidase [Microbacterium sp. Kw_RZR3]|uniref:ImmA/IrrE family metallo-endopeptidase n=1 Tax=Microbacterium sp. Kw_RZR3 TaxID=3032903 RepID=UPI0023DAFC85|nr:ImmA/IrrE family metallo-endopeptidase [Microbacterium sp. Kw_RZR3]MDF2047757.1 ImmA/IrrE family metallo-endopeptidase [Microbacterium sp. Kw_RZR3]
MTATPNYIVTTGDFIAEWMEDEDLNAAELARRLGTSRKHVSELLSGKAPLSHQVALDLERVTGIPARLWNLYESTYRGDLARLASEQELAAQYDRAKAFPLQYLRKFGYVTANARDRAGTVRQLLEILRVADLDAFWTTWRHGSVAYRRTATARDDVAKLATWLALAENSSGERSDGPPFDRPGLHALLPELRALTASDEPLDAVRTAIDSLHAVGVVLCFIPAVPGLGIHGATRWIGGRPLIQLSLLWKSDDQLWFTLFHELGHVLLHGDKDLYLSGDHTTAEDEANTWASDLLISPAIAATLPRGRDIAAVQEIAADLGIAPSIVLGRIQRETKDYAWGHSLKRKFEFSA